MPIPKDRGRHGYDWKEVSEEVAVYTGDKSLVQQHFKDEMDINTIVRRYGITAGMPFGRDGGMYGDFTGITDFQSAVDLVRDTEIRFMRLPAEVREKFRNNPGEMVRFAQSSSPEDFEAIFNKPGPPPETAISQPIAVPPIAPAIVP